MFQTQYVEKIKTQTFYIKFFFQKYCRLLDNLGTAGHATGDNTAHALCVLDN
jgi:hypothetical protein